MQQMLLIVAILSSVFLIVSYSNNFQRNDDGTSKEVWEIVKAHNKAWTAHENINEQLEYVHDDVVFIKPPFKEIIMGKRKYKDDYQKWMKHASVKYFRELNPIIKVYGSGKYAIVSFNIEMAFTYDDKIVDDWKGSDMMTLVKENGKWLITSDMFARETQLPE